MHDLSQKVISKIKEEHIVPEPRWSVFARGAVFWVLMGAMLFVGTISASLVIFNMTDIDLRFFRHMSFGKFLLVFFLTAPYIWIALLACALLFGISAFRKTRHGYRFQTLFVTSIAVSIVFILGIFGHFLKVGEHIKGMAGPDFHRFADGRWDRWQRPQDGLIAGRIIEVGGKSFGLQGFDGSVWIIFVDDDTEYIDNVTPSVGEQVGVMGEVMRDFSMRAFSIRSFPFETEEDFHDNSLRRQGDGDEDDNPRIPFPIRD